MIVFTNGKDDFFSFGSYWGIDCEVTWSKVTVKKNIFNKGNRNKLCYVDEGRMPLFYCAEFATSRRFENKESKRRSSDAQFTHKRTRYESHFYIYEFNASILLRRP